MTKNFVYGWSRTTRVKSNPISSLEKLEGDQSVIARGSGLSYGDASLNSTGNTLMTISKHAWIQYDTQTQNVEIIGNVTLNEVLRHLSTFGRCLPILPGSGRISVGGCIAANVHGKNHHIVGSFSEAVLEILLDTGRNTYLCNRNANRELFEATIGGMGLTGIITKATLKTSKLPSCVKVKSENFKSLDELFIHLEKFRSTNASAIALLNGTKRRLGESKIVSYELQYTQESFNVPLKSKNYLPIEFPFLNKYTVKLYNKLSFAKSYENKKLHYSKMTFMADKFLNANLWFGKRGFIEYQFSVPKSEISVAINILRDFHSNFNIYLSGIKLLGEKSAGFLDFSQAGYTVTITTTPSSKLYKKLHEYDARLVAANGRVYLAKDSRLSAETFELMYDRVWKLREVRSKYSLLNFNSDLSRRLNI